MDVLSYGAFSESFQSRLSGRRIPLNGTIEVMAIEVMASPWPPLPSTPPPWADTSLFKIAHLARSADQPIRWGSRCELRRHVPVDLSAMG